MKFNKVLSICKGQKLFCLYDDEFNKCQWCGTDRALYPLYNHPVYSVDELMTVASIAEADKEKYVYQTGNLPDGIRSKNAVTDEYQDDIYSVSLNFSGSEILRIIHTSRGAMLLPKRYFSPLDKDVTHYIYERYDNEDNLYFVVKAGFEIVAVLRPEGVFTTYSNADCLKEIALDMAAATEIANEKRNNASLFDKKQEDNENED